jgi:sugar fermentation stimulation protein A
VKKVFIPFPEPRVTATFLGRRKRFLADMELADGRRIVAHCPNTGSMEGCLFPGHAALLWDSRNPQRKLRHTWKAIDAGGFWVGIDTGVPNRLVEQALRAGVVPDLSAFPVIRRERKMGPGSRVDLLLEDGDARCYVEVKNVTLVKAGVARFPDSVTARGLKHLKELTRRVRKGDRAVMFFVVQREDAREFEAAADIDPDYARELKKARRAGVEVFVLGTRVSPDGVEATGLLAG